MTFITVSYTHLDVYKRQMEKRIRHDKKTPGVCIELNKGDMIFDLIRFINDGVIEFDRCV